MVDMSDKFSCITKNKDGLVIDAVNVVGCSYDEIEKLANEREKLTGNTCMIFKDVYLFEVIQLLNTEIDELEGKIYDFKRSICDFLEERHNRRDENE